MIYNKVPFVKINISEYHSMFIKQYLFLWHLFIIVLNK